MRDARKFGRPLQSARYDVAVAAVHATRPIDDGDPLHLLNAGLCAAGLRTETLACEAAGASATLGAAAAKLLLIDEGLFDRADGADFAKRSVRVARKAGRMVGLLCVEPARVFRNRDEIVAELASELDYVVGEPPAVLALFGMRRIDSLVPHLLRSGIGLIMHRVERAPIFSWSSHGGIELEGEVVSESAFWSKFVPSSIARVLSPATGADQPTPARPCPVVQMERQTEPARTMEVEVTAARN